MLNNNLILWFAQHPLGAATVLYAATVFGVLLYTYLESRDRV
jgi:hypothetical protein